VDKHGAHAPTAPQPPHPSLHIGGRGLAPSLGVDDHLVVDVLVQHRVHLDTSQVHVQFKTLAAG
jgi:hypothetical protein